MENLADDPEFISAIVAEVKSQGLFDQFRKECLADVDTKPAYQNLRQRVEGVSGKFLAQQKWTDNIRHKNQLREKLRKHIIDSGFLDTGVERIVDQVVNPKISTVFHPKIEEIVYNYLGIEKPKPVLNGSEMDVQTDFLPEDLEAVSPDSDKKSSSASSDVVALKQEENAVEELNESKEIVEDFESPAFEPLETRPPSQAKNESNDSHASAISGLTSQDSVGSEIAEFKQENSVTEDDPSEQVNGIAKDCNGQEEEASNGTSRPPEISPEVTQNDSQLSQVSSNSRLSIITSSEGVLQQQQNQHLPSQHPTPHNPRLDITEEAQMPKFNENSNEEEGELPESGGDDEPATESDADRGPHKSNFDLRQESYEFKGTERNNRFIEMEVEKPAAGSTSTTETTKEAQAEDPPKEEPTSHVPDDQPKPCPSTASLKFEENSSSGFRLRICEDSTLEQKAHDATSLQENYESIKTPLNDEHSTHSAPDVDKMDSTQVEVASLSAVQQHSEKDKSKSDRHRDRDHKRSSSSRDARRSHSSSKHGSSSSSSSRKSDHRDRKGENGNSNSNHGTSKRSSGEKRKEDDDHYSSHEKPVKKRRSTDRDSNDGAENGKSNNAGGENNTSSGKSGTDSTKNSHGSQKRGNGTQDKLNESLESSFEGFDEDQIGKKERKATPKKSDKSTKAGLPKSAEKSKGSDTAKGTKKPRKSSDKSPQGKSGSMNMDVFSFSFDKPAKLSNGEVVPENEPIPEPEISDEKDDVLRDEVEAIPSQESIGNFDGVIVLDPAELERAINANENAEFQQVTSSVDDEALENVHQANFPTTDPADLVTLSTQPVVVDQMLSNGEEMDLELLIGDQQLCGDASTMSTIQKGLDVVKNKVRKPKIASNFSEACKLMKVRRQIERQEKKKREEAKQAIKKLITENGAAIEEDQGIELEFVCDSTRSNSAPIISSPVRQKPMPNNSLDEPSLSYFPEENEMFPMNEKQLMFLKQKTDNSVFAADFTVQILDIKLHSLDPEQKESPKASLFPVNDDGEDDEIMAVEITETENISSESQCAVVLERINMNSPKWQKLRAPSVDSDGSHGQEVNASSQGMQPETDIDTSIQSKQIQDSPAATAVPASVAPLPEKLPSVKSGGKSRRVGLAKPKGATLNNNTTAILTVVDITDVKPENPTNRKSVSAPDNGAIKSQRYTASDLYKPTLNGLRSRTRTRTSEGLSM